MKQKTRTHCPGLFVCAEIPICRSLRESRCWELFRRSEGPAWALTLVRSFPVRQAGVIASATVSFRGVSCPRTCEGRRRCAEIRHPRHRQGRRRCRRWRRPELFGRPTIKWARQEASVRDLADARCVGAGHGLFEDDGELIAAGAGHGVGAADAAGEEVADVLEQLVADVMARRCRSPA